MTKSTRRRRLIFSDGNGGEGVVDLRTSKTSRTSVKPLHLPSLSRSSRFASHGKGESTSSVAALPVSLPRFAMTVKSHLRRAPSRLGKNWFAHTGNSWVAMCKRGKTYLATGSVLTGRTRLFSTHDSRTPDYWRCLNDMMRIQYCGGLLGMNLGQPVPYDPRTFSLARMILKPWSEAPPFKPR